MSKSLAGYSKAEQAVIVKRRLAARTMGIGYSAAMDAARHLGISIETPKPKAPMSDTEKEERSGRKRRHETAVGHKLFSGLFG